MDKDPIFISYHESLLRLSDIELLKGPNWINDNIISFYFEVLTRHFDYVPTMLFISPEVTQCIKVSPVSQLCIFLDPLEFHEKKFVFFALNDNEITQSSGGSHWSLLVFSRDDKTMYHYDSAPSMQQGHQALSFSKKIFNYCEIQGVFVEKNCVYQTNSFDCGIHLICNAEQIAKCVARRSPIESCSFSESCIENKRTRILDIIYELKKKTLK